MNWIIIIVVSDLFTKDGRKNLTILQKEKMMLKIWKVQQGWKEEEKTSYIKKFKKDGKSTEKHALMDGRRKIKSSYFTALKNEIRIIL